MIIWDKPERLDIPPRVSFIIPLCMHPPPSMFPTLIPPPHPPSCSVKMGPGGLDALVALGAGDMRRSLNIIQSCHMAFDQVRASYHTYRNCHTYHTYHTVLTHGLRSGACGHQHLTPFTPATSHIMCAYRTYQLCISSQSCIITHITLLISLLSFHQGRRGRGLPVHGEPHAAGHRGGGPAPLQRAVQRGI